MLGGPPQSEGWRGAAWTGTGRRRRPRAGAPSPPRPTRRARSHPGPSPPATSARRPARGARPAAARASVESPPTKAARRWPGRRRRRRTTRRSWPAGLSWSRPRPPPRPGARADWVPSSGASITSRFRWTPRTWPRGPGLVEAEAQARRASRPPVEHRLGPLDQLGRLVESPARHGPPHHERGAPARWPSRSPDALEALRREASFPASSTTTASKPVSHLAGAAELLDEVKEVVPARRPGVALGRRHPRTGCGPRLRPEHTAGDLRPHRVDDLVDDGVRRGVAVGLLRLGGGRLELRVRPRVERLVPDRTKAAAATLRGRRPARP